MDVVERESVVEREIRVEASPEVVYGYFTQPDLMTRWMGVSAKLEPEPGGLVYVDLNGANVARGSYLELTPHERIVFTWGWDEAGHEVPAGSTTVTVTLTPEGDATIVQLRHSGLTGVWVERHAEGWDHYMARLGVAGGGGDPGTDPWSA